MGVLESFEVDCKKGKYMKIQELSIEERIRLVEDIWDSIAEEQSTLPLTDAQRHELRNRLEAFRVSRNKGALTTGSIEKIRAAI